MPTVIPVRLDGLVDPAGIGVTKSDYVTIDPLLRPKALPSDELNRVLDTLVELSQENGLSDGSTPGSTLAWKKSMHEVGLASSSSFNVGLESTVVVTYSAGVCTVAMDASTDLWPVGTARTIVKANTSTFTIVADWGATKTVNGGSIVSTVLPGSHRASATTRGHVAWTILRTGESTFELFGGAPQYDTSGNLQLGSGNVVTSGTVDGRDVSTDGSTLDAHVGSTSNPHSVTAAQAGAVPTGRTITTTAPLKIDGSGSADLSAGRTISIDAATTSAAGSMSAADKTALDQLKLGVPASTVQTISSGTSATVSAGVRTVLIATGSGNFTLTMRAYNDGDEITIIKTSTDANSITIDRPGGAGTFNGASASLVLAGSTSTVGYIAWTYKVVGASAAVIV